MGTSASKDVTRTQTLYDRIATAYHELWLPVIEPASLGLLDLVAPVVDGCAEASIVDVGAGTGPLARAAVVRWPHVVVHAVDPSSGMREVGRAEAERTLSRAARGRIRWWDGVAERLPLDDASADALVSSFVYQYLPNRGAALRDAFRVLRPGGVIAVVTWLANDWSFAPWRMQREVLGELEISPPASTEPGLFRSLPSAAALVRRAGFRGVRAMPGIVEHQWTLDAFWSCAVSEDVELRDALDPGTLEELDRRWRERLERLTEDDLLYRDQIAYVTGRRPAARERTS